MPPTQTTEQPTAEQINDQYWNSDRTVDQISDELEIGRSTLYAAVRPVPAGVSCARCGERMVFTNRTNRTNETASCRACGAESQVADAVAPTAAASSGAGLPDDDRGRDDGELGGVARWRRDLAAVQPERFALVGGAAALGVVLGAAATRAVREML